MVKHTDIQLGNTVTFLVNGDEEELTGSVVAIYTTNNFDINGFPETLVDEDLPAALVEVNDTGVWLVPFAWITEVDTKVTYRVSVTFTADRALTGDEQDAILSAVEAQVSEPVMWDHDDETLVGPVDMEVTIRILGAEVVIP